MVLLEVRRQCSKTCNNGSSCTTPVPRKFPVRFVELKFQTFQWETGRRACSRISCSSGGTIVSQSKIQLLSTCVTSVCCNCYLEVPTCLKFTSVSHNVPQILNYLVFLISEISSYLFYDFSSFYYCGFT